MPQGEVNAGTYRIGQRVRCFCGFFCFPWGSPEPQSFGPNFTFFREALAIL